MFKCKKDCKASCCCCFIMSSEYTKLSDKFQITPKNIIIDNDTKQCLIETDDFKCIFLNRSNYKCEIYESRPMKCREYGITPGLECPYVKPNGNERNENQVKQQLRLIKRQLSITANNIKNNLRRKENGK